MGHITVSVASGQRSEMLHLVGVEQIAVATGPGNDTVTIGDLSGTDISSSGIAVSLGDGVDTLNATGTSVSVYGFGGAGGDFVIGGSGDDFLDGGPGNDNVIGGPGNDILSGGTGDDFVQGGAGNDAFRYDFGDGNDTISDASGNDLLLFGGVPNDAFDTAMQVGSDLVITLTDGGSVTISGQYGGNTVETAIDLRTGEVFTLPTSNMAGSLSGTHPARGDVRSRHAGRRAERRPDHWQ